MNMNILNNSGIKKGLTFDDVLVIPNASNILPSEVNTETFLTTKINLKIPLLSSPMDTVTEARLAITLAQNGGIGIIHKNMSVEEQSSQIEKVKKYESWVVKKPICISSYDSVGDLLNITNKHKISGLPVVDNDQLVGIVTNRDFKFVTDLDSKIGNIMTPKEKLITAKSNAAKQDILDLFKLHKIEKILLIDDKFQLKGLVTAKDFQKSKTSSIACKDEQGRLRVGAAIGVNATNRAEAVIEAGADVIVVDTAHGHSKAVINQISWLRKNYPNLQIIGGNIVTAEAALALVKAGVNAVKVGIGPGSICTTRIVAGIGVPQITAIQDIAKALQGTDISIIADGGIRNSGDIVKAIVAGAHVVMLGSLFAGTDESPGIVDIYKDGAYKSYRGMGSIGAMSMSNGSKDRYFQKNIQTNKLIPEGIEGRVPYKGALSPIIHQLIGGLRAGMGYTGCRNIQDLHKNGNFIQITNAGMVESHVHDVTIVKENPNYNSNDSEN